MQQIHTHTVKRYENGEPPPNSHHTHGSTAATVFNILIFTQLIEPRWALLQQDVPSKPGHLNVTTTAHKPAGFPGYSDLQSPAPQLTCNTPKQSRDKRPVIEQVRVQDEVAEALLAVL